ncbi:MAG: isochorismatase family protein [Alicyclobacillus sp.]|nr:isochorismatase family protein [Alicyclobacillus sp.]
MKKALVILDVQSEFLGNTLDYIAPLCQRYVRRSGDEYELIVTTHWVYPEAEGKSQLLVTHPRAVVVEKRGYSGFTAETKALFDQHGIDEVHIAGVDSEGAVLATMFACVDAGYKVQILERLVTSYHGRNWESMMIARHILGPENVVNIGGDRVYV